MANDILIIKGLDATSMVASISFLNKKMQASLLGRLEELIKDEDTYREVRKLILDITNDFTREVVRNIIGDVEI